MKDKKQDLQYDELYGCTLEEYCNIHNTNIETLIKKVQTDISILKSNYNKVATIIQNNEFNISNSDEDEYYLELCTKIQNLIQKKRNHLHRLLNWKEKTDGQDK